MIIKIGALQTDSLRCLQGDVPVIKTAVDTVKYILLGVVGGLIIVLGVLTTSLLCTRRK